MIFAVPDTRQEAKLKIQEEMAIVEWHMEQQFSNHENQKLRQEISAKEHEISAQKHEISAKEHENAELRKKIDELLRNNPSN
jgi:septal ring factor EnvC (AmiA/AmiB activator)